MLNNIRFCFVIIQSHAHAREYVAHACMMTHI